MLSFWVSRGAQRRTVSLQQAQRMGNAKWIVFHVFYKKCIKIKKNIFKVWDASGHIMFSSSNQGSPVSCLSWNLNGQILAVGAHNSLRLCQNFGVRFCFINKMKNYLNIISSEVFTIGIDSKKNCPFNCLEQRQHKTCGRVWIRQNYNSQRCGKVKLIQHN